MEKILGYDKDKLYMVHLTDFFPKEHRILSNYDGNKMYDKYIWGEKIKIFLGDEAKDVIIPAHRHTVHFAINSVVEAPGDGSGNWDDKPMAILEPLIGHEEQFLNLNSDSFTWGSVDLSDNAIIIISKKALDLIPKEERDKWNFIVCEGDISQAVKKFFIENNLPIRRFEENSPEHASSIAIKVERNLQYRDRAINYVKDNTFDGKSDIEFTLEEFSKIMSISIDSKNKWNCNLSGIGNITSLINSQTFSIFKYKNGDYKPNEVIETIIASGFYINEDGKIKLKSDEEIYDKYQKIKKISYVLREEKEQYSEFTEDLMSEASQLYYKYIEILQEKPKEELLDCEKQIIQETVQAIEEKEYIGLNESEKKIIDTYILNSKTSDLSAKEIEIAKQMRPKGLSIDDNNYISIMYTPVGEVEISIGGNYPEDFENLKRKFQNVKRSKV